MLSERVAYRLTLLRLMPYFLYIFLLRNIYLHNMSAMFLITLSQYMK